jgi:hypothetical protein
MYRLAILSSALAVAASAATLQKLTLDDMIAQCSDIVRGRVVASSAAFKGTPGRAGIIYTHYTISVAERWKGNQASKIDVAVPGGVALGYRQVFAGAPSLSPGDEYVFFLWTSRSGLTQIIGLTQGLFSLSVDASGRLTMNRASSSESVVDPVTGQAAADEPVSMRVSELGTRVSARLKAAN